MDQNKVIINNAISAYFWLAALFLFLPTKKENIKHPFVKSHAKTAVLIHFLFFLTYTIFIWFRLGWNIGFFGFYLNFILASALCLGLFVWMLYGVLKASKWETFAINDVVSMSKADQLFEMKESKLNEQGIVTIILTLIPFVWILIAGKYEKYKSPIIENNVKFNTICSFIILTLFNTNNGNVAVLLGLAYIVSVVFFSIILITNKNLILLRLEFIPSLSECVIYMQTWFRYLVKYFKKDAFEPLKQIYLQVINEKITQDALQLDMLSSFPKPKFAQKMSYIPILNLILIVDIKSTHKFHIINGIWISILAIVMFFTFTYSSLLYLLFPLFAGWGNKNKLNYKLPFIFSISQFILYFLKKILFLWEKVKEKHQITNEITLK